MNPLERRHLIAHAAMGLAACIGGYMALVDGPRKALSDARAQTRSLSDQVRTAEGLCDQVPAMTAAVNHATQEASTIADTGRLAREERSLFAAVMSLAGTHSVRVDELHPAKLGSSSVKDATAAAAAPGDVTVGYSMVAIASYQDIVAFTAALRNELGYSLIRSVRLTPAPDDRVKLVRAVIETEHYSFDTSPRQSPVADAGAK